MAPRVLFIGLGNMGRGMCKNIAEKGPLGDEPLMIYNRSTVKALALSQKLPPKKTEVMETLPAAVAKADIVFTCLANDEAVQQTLQTALSGDVKGKLFVECSTIHPDTTEALAKAVLAQGAEFVAAPVFGAPPMAEAGQLVGVLAGPQAAVERARPYFRGVTSRAEIDMIDKPYRASTTLKIIGNTFILSMVEQLGEGLVLAEKSGLGTDALHMFVEAMFPGPCAAYSKRMLSGDYYQRDEPLFAIDLARKDARHAMDLGRTAGTRLHNVEVADKHLSDVKEHMGEKGDIAGIYGAMRKESGLKFENKS